MDQSLLNYFFLEKNEFVAFSGFYNYNLINTYLQLIYDDDFSLNLLSKHSEQLKRRVQMYAKITAYLLLWDGYYMCKCTKEKTNSKNQTNKSVQRL